MVRNSLIHLIIVGKMLKNIEDKALKRMRKTTFMMTTLIENEPYLHIQSFQNE